MISLNNISLIEKCPKNKTSLLVRLSFGFVSDSVFDAIIVRLNQNDIKYWDGNAVMKNG